MIVTPHCVVAFAAAFAMLPLRRPVRSMLLRYLRVARSTRLPERTRSPRVHVLILRCCWCCLPFVAAPRCVPLRLRYTPRLRHCVVALPAVAACRA